MRKFYSVLITRLILFIAISCGLVNFAKGQITISSSSVSNFTYNSATADGAIVFAVRNTNTTPITITNVRNYVQASFTATFTLWYHPTAVTGAPTAINTTNGWVNVASVPINNTTAGIVDIFTGLTLTIPANTTYRLAISGPAFSPYYAGALLTPNFYQAGGVEIYTQDNPSSPGYGGAFPGGPANTPRGFIGSITFIPGAVCTDPPVAGNAVAPPAVCSGSGFSLNLSGNSQGTGQTYQWQSSPDNSTWTNIGSSSASPVYNTSVTVPTYFRAGVTCGATTIYSSSVLVNPGTSLSGTYTINSINPTGGTNFQSFTDAINHLVACGVSGAVRFDVAAGGGPYTEQLTIPPVPGASAVNTITFNGNGNTLQFTPNITNRFVIRLNGADYITFKKLNIVTLDATYGWGVHLLNGADRNTIDSCTINVSAVTSTTEANSACIVSSNASNSVTTASNANFNTFSNNTMTGGYNTVILNGTATGVNGNGNLITKNTIQNFYANGVALTQQDGTVVSYNDIHRANRVTVTTFAGVELGAGNRNVVVNGNRIHDTHTTASAQTGTAYGVFANACDAPAGSENKVINNLIYNFNSGSGTIYGLYNSGSDSVQYYHNTIVLDNAGSTAGITRGFYQTTLASGIVVKNNIITIARGGTGVKYCLYFGTTTSPISSNNNVLLNTSSAGTNGIGSFGTTGYPTLANWQTANGGIYDLQSLSVNPLFVNPGGGDYTPAEPIVNNAGANVGVATDILNNPRTVSAPDPGAYEFTLGGCTNPPTAGIATTSATPVCANVSFTLDLTGNSIGDGQNYSWQSSTDNSTWTDISAPVPATSFVTSQTTSHYYRCAVKCAAGTTVYSTSVFVVTNPLVSGTFTINSGSATGSGNFQTFADAINYIRCGINGPVVFNVTAGSGPYDEFITIPSIPGASAVNTITFNGNSAIIQATPTTVDRHIIRLDGADYITIRKLSVLAIPGSTFGWGIHFTNGANYNTIDSCTIDISTVISTTQSNSAGIVCANSTTSVTADGSASNNTISNNTIIGAYQGIIFNGTAGSLNAVNNTFTKNTVQDFYANGIELTDNDGSVVSLNDIHRMNRAVGGTATTVVTTFAGVELGVGNKNCLVNANRIHDTHNNAGTDQGDAAYGIFSNGDDAAAGSENKVTNNLIYNFNSATGIQYGINSTGSDGVRYYHNTIVLDNASSTAGNTRGFYQTTLATNIEFKNNIVFIARGGTGGKYCVYINTTTSTVASDYNNLYNSTSSSTSGIGSFGTTGFATLVDWKTANTNAYDQQSMSVDPAFANPGAADYYPNNAALDNAGTNLGVTHDIVGILRDPITPVPGAYEIIAAAGTDMGAISLLLPEQKNCYSNAETVTVTIRNYSATTHNFVTNPVTVNASVTGPNATTFAPVVINTGSLPAGGLLDVIITNSYNMTAVGTYSFNASTTVTGDLNSGNNALPGAATVTVDALDAGTAATTRDSYCVTGGTPTLSVTGSSGGNIQWQSSLTGVAGSWANVGTNSTSYTPASAITATTYYRAYVVCGANSDTSNVVTVSLDNPQLLTTTPGTRCGPGTVTLNATASAGSTINWYTNVSGGTPIATGTSFVTPILSSNATYYAAASSGGGSGVQTVGPNDLSIGAAANFTALVQYSEFEVYSATTIQTVDVFWGGAVGSPFTIIIRDATTLATVFSYPGTTTVTGTTTPQVVPINASLPPGSYQFGFSVNPGAYRNSTGAVYPYSLPGILSITGNTFGVGYYYFFYRWQVATGCESPRTAVTATVNTAPAFDVTANHTVCNNAVTPLTVTSNLPDFDSYIWSPSAGLYTDAAGTIAYTGGHATTVYAKNAGVGTYTYYATANNTTTLCANIDSVKVTVLPAAVSLSATPSEVCVSGSTTITIGTAGEYTNATYQWYTSPDGVTFTSISAATTNSYTTPVLTSTTHYKLEIKNSAGAVCLQPTITINVNNPQVLTSTPATRCGPGTLTLNATGSAGSTLNWYGTAVGGASLGTGTSFTTPSISATTNYWVAASVGGGSSTAAPMPPQSTTFTGNVRGYWFTAPVSFRITGLTDMGTGPGAQSIAVVRFNPSVTPPTYSAVTNAFTTLFITQNNPATGVIPVNILINAGDVIGILGQRGTTGSYGTPNPYTTTIAGQPVALNRLGMQFPLTTTAPQDLWQEPGSTSITRVEIIYETGCESPRTLVTATVNESTAINTHPTTQSVCPGSNVTLTVGAVGGNLTYQWRKGGIDINGATSSSYTITGATAGDAGIYDVIVTGTCGAVTSNQATLSLKAVTGISNHPNAQAVCLGSNATFNVTASGAGTLTYQWRKDGNIIGGANGSSFTITGVAAGDLANYDVIVTGDCGPVTSNIAALTLATQTGISTQPTPQGACIGGNVTFSAAGTGSGTITYQWRKGGININGATSANYTITGVTAGDVGNYDVIVTGNCGFIISNSVALTINAITAINIQPVGSTICATDNVTLTVAATGTNLTYQWRKGGVNINGATSASYTITGATTGDAGNYDVIVTGACGSINSNSVAIVVNAPGTWLGTTSQNWNTASNWCGTIPTSTTDVIIPSTAPNMPILSAGNGFARNITINNGASLVIGAGGNLDLYGNITGAGSFNATSGNIAFRGATAQSTPGFTAVNVTMNGAGGVTPAGNTTISGTLTLTNGNVTLGNNNLTLNNSTTGTTNSHIVTNGTGNVVVPNLAASQSRTIPVGSDATSYNPARLVANAGHVTDNFTVRVQQGVFENGVAGTTYSSHIVNRMWHINEGTVGGSNVNVTLQWVPTQELPSFDRTKCYVMHHNGTRWLQGTGTAATGTDPFTQTRNNVTSFSPFAVQTQPIPMPVTGIFPNPVTAGFLNVVTDLRNDEGDVWFSIYDTKGRLVYRNRKALFAGVSLTRLDILKLSAGVYILKVSTNGDRELITQRFFKSN